MLEEIRYRLRGFVWLTAALVRAGNVALERALEGTRRLEERGRQGRRARAN